MSLDFFEADILMCFLRDHRKKFVDTAKDFGWSSKDATRIFESTVEKVSADWDAALAVSIKKKRKVAT